MGKRAQLMTVLSEVMESAARIQKDRSSGQESMFGEILEPEPERLPDIPEWDDKIRLAMEKEALGFYITGHPLNAFSEKLKKLSVVETKDLQDLQDRQNIVLGGMVMDIKKIQTKRTGDLMAYVTIEDLYGMVEVIAFPDVYKECQEMLTSDVPVVISGTIDKTDKGMKIMANKIVSIDHAEDLQNFTPPGRTGNFGYGKKTREERDSRPERKRIVTLTVYNDKRSMLPRLDEVLSRHSGDCPVFLRIVSPENWETILKTNREVMPSPEMLSEAESLLGEGRASLS
jgi:DNA polymerase-3 subunit alpha